MSLYKKLLEIQTEVTAFTKDKSTFNYKYTTGDQVLNKIRPLMNEKGILLKQEVLDICNTREDYTTGKGVSKTEILTKALMRFTWVDTETGDKDENLFGANGFNDWDKGLGSALTYAERYFLLKFFHVPTDEDDPDSKGMASSSNKEQSTTKESTNTDLISESQRKRLFAISKEKNITDETVKEILKDFNYVSSKEIKKKDYENIIKKIEDKGGIKSE